MDNNKNQGVVFVGADDDLQAVLSCFRINDISHVPVLADKKVIGMVSKTDVVEFLYDAIEEKSGETYLNLLQSIRVKELMIQPVIEADVNDTQMTVLEKLLNHRVGSVVLKDNGEIKGILTEKDMIRLLAKEVESDMSFSEKLGLHVVQWLDKNGIIRVSRMLSDIGI